MSEYAVSEIVKEVKVLLDRNQETAELLPTDTDTLSQGEIIRNVIVDAAKAIEELAPASKLDAISTASDKAEWTFVNGAYVGLYPLPVSLMRILRVKVSDWIRPGILISENDDEYLHQQNQHVRGNPQRPIAALVHVDGNRCLELYTSNTSTSTVSISYVPTPEITTEDNISLCGLLKGAILYMSAYLTCISLGDIQTAAGFKSTAYQLAGIVEPSQTQ